jgi:hypothetical protein
MFTEISRACIDHFYLILAEVGKGVMQGEIMKAANENDADTVDIPH